MTTESKSKKIRSLRNDIARLNAENHKLEHAIADCEAEKQKLYRGLNREKDACAEADKARLAAIVESTQVAIISKSLSGIILSWNQGAEKMYGYTAAEAIGRPYTFLVPGGQTDIFPELFQTIARGITLETPTETQLLHKDGHLLHVFLALSPIKDDQGDITSISTIAYDISARKRAEAKLKEANDKLYSTLNSITDGYFKLGPTWEFMEMNPAAEKIFGPIDNLIGKNCWQRYPEAVGSPFYLHLHQAVETGHPQHFETRAIVSGKWHEIHAYPRKTCLEIYFRDISDRKRFEEEIKHLAYHDLLTGLPNKTLLIDIFNIEAAHARRSNTKIGILFLDLDGFKDINDRFGHAAGDRMLKEVASRLKRRMRGADIVARVGGDEFTILLPNIGNTNGITTIARKIIQDLHRPYAIYGQDLHVTTSIGISVFPDDSTDIETLCRYADIAMYHAKQKGRNNYKFYNPAIDISSIERIRMENQLRQAIANNELELYYQPQQFADNTGAACAEVLLRWRHPEAGLLLPEHFISLAEETGLMVPIGQWVVHTACRQNREWQKAGYPALCLAINLSDRQFYDPSLSDSISAILSRTGMPASHLEFEITENTAMRDFHYSLPRLKQLAAMGFGLSLDNFGIGFCRLSQLIRMPIKKLKIHRCFIQDIAPDSAGMAIIEAMLALTRQMRIKVIAEGVETIQQRDILKQYGCDSYQGYVLSKPLAADRFETEILQPLSG
ncbi:MAG: sensor domain-containing protein [Thermodesulfobacteriota bacterium]